MVRERVALTSEAFRVTEQFVTMYEQRALLANAVLRGESRGSAGASLVVKYLELDGVNDRVFSYALSRAVCFTNAEGYLRPAFGEDNGLCFYSMRNLSELGEQVKSLLARPDALRESGERAREVVVSSHTWRHRVGDMLGAMRPKPGIGSGVLPPVPRPR